MEILLKPLVTEKMTELSEKLNRVGFVVDRRATKIDIRRAVEKMYSVKVVSVNTMNYQGKTKSRFTKAGAINGRTVSFKKAIITLVEGDNIDFYSNI
ncbi:50S ribosomal protein L23 [Ancylomarina sp.]|uniref:50S ribosomal protein L23 n=1 Tax=Ancylomarina sp. TaxID=1970196 RepID=UPI0035681278